MTAATAESAAAAQAGRTELGTITIADSVVSKIAARAAAENPDAGLPKASVDVDGSKAFLNLEISVRWPASVPAVTDQVRSHLRSRVTELTGLTVEEVHIVVADLATDIAPPPRVR
jgi:uncharacterized alkaline shock family protein YloU